MSWWLPFYWMLATLPTTSQEMPISLQDSPPISQEDLEFIQSLENPQEVGQQKCSYGSASPIPSSTSDFKKGKFLLFTSLSMPLESWRAHSFFLQKIGGCFVLQGLPDNSFPSLSKKIQELRKAGVHAEIVLDPPAFEKYKVEAIPSLVLDNGEYYDKISGNIDIPSVLNLFAKTGDTRQTATDLLKSLEVQ